MPHSLTALRALFGLDRVPVPRGRSRHEPGRDVLMHVTLDAQHVTPLRQALTRDCGDQPWTIRVAPLPGTDRMRLSLYLPRTAVDGAMQRVAHLAPAAEVGQLVEIPHAPTDAWRDLIRAGVRPRRDARAQREEAAPQGDTIAQLLREEHVLLGLDVADRDALFVQLGRFVEQRYGLVEETVTARLAAREALGSTGLGQGVAGPHGQIEGLRQAIVLYARTVTPIAFDAPDGKPGSDVVMLLVPQ